MAPTSPLTGSDPIEMRANVTSTQRLCSKTGPDTRLRGAVTAAPAATPISVMTGPGCIYVGELCERPRAASLQRR